MSICILNVFKTSLLHRPNTHRTISKYFLSRCKAPVMFAGHSGKHRSSSCPHYCSFSTTNQALKDLRIYSPPSIKKFIKNKFMTYLIKFYYDETFSSESFLRAARQAIVHVSNLISAGRFEALQGLLTPDAIAEIQRKYAKMSPHEQREISVQDENVVGQLIHEIGMVVKNENDGFEKEKMYIEVTVVLHEVVDEVDKVKLSMKSRKDLEKSLNSFLKNIKMTNYRFIREFTKGEESDWTINKLNHFMLAENGEN